MKEPWRAYFELLRFPAVFTVIANVMMGFLVARGALHPRGTFVLLATISSLLYLSGMVLNDVFDADVDSRERPRRPIPSNRISRASAKTLGWSMLTLGLLLATHIALHGGEWRTSLVSFALAGCIVLYDAGVKRTWAGPLAMGTCRLLNVLLGMSLASAPDGLHEWAWTTTEIMLAAGVGLYIVGVTVFARAEASVSSRRLLANGIAILLAGIALIAFSPVADGGSTPLLLGESKWSLLWGLLSIVIVRRCTIAWRTPVPESVQSAVRTCLRAIIVIDAAIVLGYCGPFWSGAVLALLAPMLLLERWASTT